MHNNKLNIPKNLDWELLKRFQVVVHSSTFGEAAIKIGTGQGALVKQMTTLESALKTDLFVRTAKKRSIELTPAGKTLAINTEIIHDIVQGKLIKDLKTYQKEDKLEVKTRSIKIITTPGLSTTLLPEVVLKFLENEFNVKVFIHVNSSPIKIDVNEIIIRHNFLPQTNLKTEYITTFNSSFYGTKQYFEKYGIPSSFEDLFHHKVLSFKFFDLASTHTYTLDQKANFYIEPDIESDFIFFLIEMALRHQGLIELPDSHPVVHKFIKVPKLLNNKADIYVSYLNIATQDVSVYNVVKYLKELNGVL